MMAPKRKLAAKKAPSKKAGPGGPATPEQIAESEAFIAALARQELSESIDDAIRHFEEHRNGLALWRAYEECRVAGEPVPEVLLRYFDKMASALGTADTAEQVAAALHMTGRPGGSARQHLAAADRHAHLLSKVHFLAAVLPQRRRLSINAACKRVAAQYGLNWMSLKRAYSRARAEPNSPVAPARSVFEWRPHPQD